MAGLMMIPTQEGLREISDDLKESLKYAILLSAEKDEIARYEFDSAYYDQNGVLTALFEIPISQNLTIPTKYLRIESSDGVIISEGETPEITFVTGVGGVQTIKFAVSGEAGEVVFKNHDYITNVEFEERYLPIVVAMTDRLTQLENKLIEKGVIDA